MTRAIFLLSCAAALLAAPGTVSAQEKRPEVVRLRVGIAEHYKVGQWTPVEITLRGGSEPMTGQVSLTVPDGDGVPSRVVTPPNKPCQVLPGQETSVLLYARFGEINSEATVALRVGDRVVAAKSFTSSMEADAEHYAFGHARRAAAGGRGRPEFRGRRGGSRSGRIAIRRRWVARPWRG